jgi:hypothetical protein
MLVADVDVAAVLAGEVCCAVIESVEQNPPFARKVEARPKLFLGGHHCTLVTKRLLDGRDIIALTISRGRKLSR